LLGATRAAVATRAVPAAATYPSAPSLTTAAVLFLVPVGLSKNAPDGTAVAAASGSGSTAAATATASTLSRYSFYEYMTPAFSAEEDLTRVAAARIRIAEEARNLEERLLIRQREVAAMKAELRALGVL